MVDWISYSGLLVDRWDQRSIQGDFFNYWVWEAHHTEQMERMRV